MAGKGIFSGSSSIGGCDQYSNPYDMRLNSHPGVVHRRQEIYLKSQDTLSSAHLRLEKEIFLKMQEDGLDSPISRFVVVATIGKFVFLAIMLPPYMLCYGIPKWIVTVGLLKIQALMTRIFRSPFKKLSNLANKIIGRLKVVYHNITSPILNFIQTRIEKLSRLYQMLRQFGQKTLTSSQKMIQKLFSPIGSKAMALTKMIKEKAESIAKRTESLISDVVQAFKNPAVAFTRFFGAQKLRLSKMVSRLKQVDFSFLNRLKLTNYDSSGIKVFLANKWSRIRSAAEFLINRVKGPINEVRKKIQSFLEPVREKISSNLSVLRHRIIDPINNFFVTFQRMTEAMMQQFKKKAMILVHPLEQVAQPMLSLFTFMGTFKKSFFGMEKRKTIFKSVVHRTKDLLDSAFSQAKKWIRGQGKKMAAKIKKQIIKQIAKLKQVPMIVFHFLQKFFRIIFEALKGTFLLLFLMSVWMKALIRYGMHVVRESTRHLLFKRG